MEKRLNAMRLEPAPFEVKTSPLPSEELVQLLLQGLQNKDDQLLNTVLQTSDEMIIRNLVKKLPQNTIAQFLRILHKKLLTEEQGNRSCLKWLKEILVVHVSYLKSLEEIDDFLSFVTRIIRGNEETLPKMKQLKGFLDILHSQIDINSERNVQLETEPLEVYEFESSSDEMDEQDVNEDQLCINLDLHENNSQDETD